VVDAAGPVPLLLTLHEARVLDAAPSPAFRNLVGRAAVITVPAAHDAEQVARRMGRDRASVRVIPPGATLPDDEREAPIAREIRDALGARPGRPLWVAPLRLETGRGHDVLLRALAEVNRRGLPFVALLPGGGPLKPLLADTAESLGLSGHIRFEDAMDDPGPLLWAADAVIFPVMGGPVPFSLLDAMARERMVVASDIPAIRETLAGGSAGTLVPTADPHALADALEALHRRPGDAVPIGREAARRVDEELSWERVLSACEEAYDETLGLATFAPAEESRR
jgi:glycosyltransferase involved in cell wall biosynthesis